MGRHLASTRHNCRRKLSPCVARPQKGQARRQRRRRRLPTRSCSYVGSFARTINNARLYVTRVSASHTKLSMRWSENSPVEELEKKKDRTRSRSATNALGRAVIRKRINIWVFGMETSSNVAPVDKFENLLRSREPLSWQTSSEERERPRKFKICPLVSFEVLRALRATLRQIRFDFEIQTRERGSKFMGLLK